MYDVLYAAGNNQSQVVAQELARESAVDVAREEARRRKAGRMFLAGSEQVRTDGATVLIVESTRRAA